MQAGLKPREPIQGGNVGCGNQTSEENSSSIGLPRQGALQQARGRIQTKARNKTASQKMVGQVSARQAQRWYQSRRKGKSKMNTTKGQMNQQEPPKEERTTNRAQTLFNVCPTADCIHQVRTKGDTWSQQTTNQKLSTPGTSFQVDLKVEASFKPEESGWILLNTQATTGYYPGSMLTQGSLGRSSLALCPA